jgi:hypothetical protein
MVHLGCAAFQINKRYKQCCGSGSGIRGLFLPLDPGSRMGKNQDLDRDEQPGSYLRELRNSFWVKILKFCDEDPGWKKFGSGMEKFHVWDTG